MTHHVVVGTYEGLLIGYDISTSLLQHKQEEPIAKLCYAYAAHERCILSLCSAEKLLASCSTDETVKLYLLDKRQELVTLSDHQKSVNTVDLKSQEAGMITGAEDGSIIYYKGWNWSSPFRFQAHKGRVNAVALHPSGKVALSVGKDGFVKLWNTSNGNCVCALELLKEALQLSWMGNGEYWVISTQKSFSIHSLQSGLVQHWEYPCRLVCVCPISSDRIVTGGMDGFIRMYQIGEEQCIRQWKVDGTRVKGIGVGSEEIFYSLSSDAVIEVSTEYFVSASDSHFRIQKAWNINDDYVWVEKLPTGYRPTTFHVVTSYTTD
eukprot:jgi/Galph1/3489/GphlegSOOS_G2180.1